MTSAPFSGTYDLEGTLTWAPVRADLTVQIIVRSTDTRCPSRTLAASRPDTGTYAFTGADVKPGGELPPPGMFTVDIVREESMPGEPSPLASVTLVGRHVATTTLSLR